MVLPLFAGILFLGGAFISASRDPVTATVFGIIGIVLLVVVAFVMKKLTDTQK
jgi:hypothetical protein